MATIDLPKVLEIIGDDLKESVKAVVESVNLPDDLKEKGIKWAADATVQLAKAGAAKMANDGAAYDAAMLEIGYYRKAARAIAVAEVMVGLHAAEVEGRKRLAGAIDLGISIGLKLLAAALV